MDNNLEAKEQTRGDVVVNAMNCRGDAYDANCGNCMRARGIRRQHRKGAMKHEWSVSADLSGPHPTALGTNYRYLLVAVITMEDGVSRLPFVKGLASKRGEEVATKIQDILIELRAITGAQKSIVRLHSDAGKEFINAETKKVVDENGIFQSHTGGYDPKSNGLAERFV